MVGPRVAVACGADAVAIFDLDGAPIATVDLPHGSRPVSVAPWIDGAALVALAGDGAVAEIGLDPPSVIRIVEALPDPRGIATAEGGAWVARHRSAPPGGEVLWLDGQLEATITTTLPVDVGPDSDTNARGVPTYLHRIAVRPDGRVAAIGGLKANTERGAYREGRPLTPDTTARADLRIVALDPGEGPVGDQTATAIFDDRDLVSGLAFSPLGDWLFVAHLGMETVDVLDAYTLTRSGAIQGVGHGPDALWVDPTGSELWVLATLSRQLVVFDLTAGVAAPAEIDRIDLQPPGGEALDGDVLQGKIVFHRSADGRMSQQGYLSCASCHLDGEHDGLTWDFTQRGEGLRNTTSLLGATSSHGPIHWSANFDELADFENDIRGGQGGSGFLTDEDWAATEDPLGAPKAGLSDELDALATYLSTLTEVPRFPVARRRRRDGPRRRAWPDGVRRSVGGLRHLPPAPDLHRQPVDLAGGTAAARRRHPRPRIGGSPR